jgi:hypothetical protein
MKTLLKVLLALVLLGGAGFGVWWFFIDAEERNLRGVHGYTDDEVASAWDWVSGHGDRPAVRHMLKEEFNSLLNDAAAGRANDPYQERRLERIGSVFTRFPATEPELASYAMSTWARFEYEPAKAWVKDPAIARKGLIDALEALPKWFRSKEANVPLAQRETARLLGELERIGVKSDAPELVQGVVQNWLRFRAPAARAGFENARTAHPEKFLAAVTDRLIHGTNYSALEPDEEETELLITELSVLKPELTREFWQAIARLSDRKATPKLFKAWGPSSVEAFRGARGTFETYAQTEADALLAALGGTAEPGAVKRKIDSLYAYTYGDNLMKTYEYEDYLGLLTMCSHDFSSRVESVIPRVIDELAQMPTEALLETWSNDGSQLTQHLLSRALAKKDPEALTQALEPMWNDFAPTGRAAEKAKQRAKNMDEFMVSNFRREAPRLSEALTALREAKPSKESLRHLWPAVSSPYTNFSSSAVSLLDERLDDDEFVLGLFAYFDQRSSYSVDEINGWVALMSKRQESAKILGKAMSKVLEISGSPESVPMVHKIVGLSSLSASSCGCKAVLQKYAADTDTYESKHWTTRGNETIDSTSATLKFADLAKAALSR